MDYSIQLWKDVADAKVTGTKFNGLDNLGVVLRVKIHENECTEAI